MTRAKHFHWSKAREAAARRLYLDEGLRPCDVAQRMGEGLTAHQIQSLVARHGWAKLRPGYRYWRWTAQRDADLRRFYLDVGLQPRAIAVRLGRGATVDCVQRRIIALDLADELEPEERRRRRIDCLDLARQGVLKARAARGQFVWTDRRQADLERLYLEKDTPPAEIAKTFGCEARIVRRRIKQTGLFAKRQAMGKGRMRVRRIEAAPTVTRLPAGAARGLSAIEGYFHAAPPAQTAEQLAMGAKGRATAARNRELLLTAEALERRALAAPEAVPLLPARAA